MAFTQVALVGCGYWGNNLCRVLAQHSQTKLRWVCDANAEALERAGRIAPEARKSNDLAAVLSDPEVEGIVVATPVDTHFELGCAAIAAGKHVLVEKPLCRSVDEAKRLCAAADRQHRVLMVGHTFLYNGAVRWVKRMLDEGSLGDVYYLFTRRLNLGIVRKDVDALWSLAPHDLSILNYWIARRVVSASAVGHSFLQSGIADMVFAHLTYDGNIGAHIQVSWLDPIKVRQVTVVGSRRMLVYDDLSVDGRIVVYDKGIDVTSLNENLGTVESYAQHQLKVRAGDAWMPRIELREPLVEEIDEFVACIREGRTPLTDGASGIEVVSQLECLSRTMRTSNPR